MPCIYHFRWQLIILDSFCYLVPRAANAALILKHIVGSQIKGSRYKGLYVLLPLMDFNEKLMDFNGFQRILIILGVRSGFPRVEGVESEPWEARRGPRRAKPRAN